MRSVDWFQPPTFPEMVQKKNLEAFHKIIHLDEQFIQEIHNMWLSLTRSSIILLAYDKWPPPPPTTKPKM
jgi:hypothetical protein